MALDQTEVLEGLIEIIVEETGLPGDTITADQSFVDDLDIDSLSMMTIVALAEDKFDVRIPDEAVGQMTTVGGAVDYILKVGEPS
jgi:acyl carrier protein